MINTPRPFKIYRTSQGKLGIEWMDHTRSEFNLWKLRVACPCASCVDEWTGERMLDPQSVPADIALEHIQAVGRYAVGITWSDGHRSGIYTYERLQKLSPPQTLNNNV